MALMPPPIRAAWKSRPGYSFFGRVGAKGNSHAGYDYYCPLGTPIYAVGAGRVTGIGYDPSTYLGSGHWVSVKLDNGHTTRDCHMQARTALNLGDRVTAQTVLGHVGNTGNAINVPWRVGGVTLWYLHHEHRIGGKLVDPLPLYTAPASFTATPITAPAPEQNQGEVEMIVFANKDTDVWVAGVPAGGFWRGIPAGQGEAYVKISGRARVDLSEAEFVIARDACLAGRDTDVKVYANVENDQWFLIGPGAFYAIPPGKGDLYVSLFGPYVPANTATIDELRASFGQATVEMGDGGYLAGVIGAIDSLPAKVSDEADKRARQRLA